MNAPTEIRAGVAEVEPFDVIGVSVVTTNAEGQATEDINVLWERFFKESIGQKVASKVNDVIYAVYSDYEGDHTQPYRLTIGYKVSTKDDIPDGCYAVSVAPSTYAVMSAAGSQPQALLDTWEAIWSSDLERAYATDFEVYGPRFFQDGLNEVLVHVGIQG